MGKEQSSNVQFVLSWSVLAMPSASMVGNCRQMEARRCGEYTWTSSICRWRRDMSLKTHAFLSFHDKVTVLFLGDGPATGLDSCPIPLPSAVFCRISAAFYGSRQPVGLYIKLGTRVHLV